MEETFLKSYFQQPIYLNKNWETYVVTKANSPYFKNQQKVEIRWIKIVGYFWLPLNPH